MKHICVRSKFKNCGISETSMRVLRLDVNIFVTLSLLGTKQILDVHCRHTSGKKTFEDGVHIHFW